MLARPNDPHFLQPPPQPLLKLQRIVVVKGLIVVDSLLIDCPHSQLLGVKPSESNKSSIMYREELVQ